MNKAIEQGTLGQDREGRIIRYALRQGRGAGQANLVVEGFLTFDHSGPLQDLQLVLAGYRGMCELLARTAA